jgi:hypothetical protein
MENRNRLHIPGRRIERMSGGDPGRVMSCYARLASPVVLSDLPLNATARGEFTAAGESFTDDDLTVQDYLAGFCGGLDRVMYRTRGYDLGCSSYEDHGVESLSLYWSVGHIEGSKYCIEFRVTDYEDGRVGATKRQTYIGGCLYSSMMEIAHKSLDHTAETFGYEAYTSARNYVDDCLTKYLPHLLMPNEYSPLTTLAGNVLKHR